jgi:hypothetical protein
MLIYILVLLSLLCLLDLIRIVACIVAVACADNSSIVQAVFSLVWRVLSIGAKITAFVFVILLL